VASTTIQAKFTSHFTHLNGAGLMDGNVNPPIKKKQLAMNISILERLKLIEN